MKLKLKRDHFIKYRDRCPFLCDIQINGLNKMMDDIKKDLLNK